MVESSQPDNLSDEEYKGEEREPRGSIRVTDPKLFENEGQANDILTDESCQSFTVKNP